MMIEILENEYWWGGIVDMGYSMPYSSRSHCTLDLTTMGTDQNMPLFLSNMGRYIWSEKPFVIHFENGVIRLETDDPVELGEGYGTLKGAHKAAADKHFACSGIIPSEQFFRVPQYNTWIELMYDQNQVQILEYAHTIVDSGMTPGILMIDEGWSEDYGVFDFYPGRFSDPKRMIQELHELGFTVMLWVTPHISPDSNAFRALRDTSYLLKDKTGEFAIRKWWNGFSCVLDLSNPDARSWFKGKLDYVMKEYGVDGFKFDAGDSCMYESDDHTYAPRLPLDHTSDYDAFAAQYPVNELRAVWKMGGEPLVCRLHDKMHDWTSDGLNTIIPNTILQGLLGCYYGCPDMIGGGNYASFLQDGFHLDEELYLRWLETSVLCPMMQFSIAPWRVLSAENFGIVKKLIAFRTQFADHFVELAKNAAANHEPIIRHLEYEFPHEGYAGDNSMYMLGDQYLVVPMLEKGQTSRNVRLPSGAWKDLRGNGFEGGSQVELAYALDTLHVFERC